MFLPSTLGMLTNKDWKFFRHIQVLERRILETLYSDSQHELIVEMPVQHGKSEYCTKLLISWYMLLYPEKRVILSTYNSSYSERWGFKILSLLENYGKSLTGWEVHPASKTRRLFHHKNGQGQFACFGAGGGVSGTSGDLIVCDDLVKDQQAANSPSQRQELWTRFNSELMTRRQLGSKVIVVMSRRHPEDLSGRLAELGWPRLTLPAVDFSNPEQPKEICPELHPLRELLEVKRVNEESGSHYVWECLYQQNPIGDPSVLEWPSSYFDGIEYDELPPDVQSGQAVKYRILSLDPSKGTNSHTGDYSALLEVILDKSGHLWINDGYIRVQPYEEVIDLTLAWIHRTAPHAFGMETCVGQEIMLSSLVNKAKQRGVRLPLTLSIDSKIEKVSRVRMNLSPLLAQKRVHIKRGHPHLRILLNQLRQFPKGSHDDGPDSLEMATQVINYLIAGKSQDSNISQYR